MPQRNPGPRQLDCRVTGRRMGQKRQKGKPFHACGNPVRVASRDRPAIISRNRSRGLRDRPSFAPKSLKIFPLLHALLGPRGETKSRARSCEARMPQRNPGPRQLDYRVTGRQEGPETLMKENVSHPAGTRCDRHPATSQRLSPVIDRGSCEIGPLLHRFFKSLRKTYSLRICYAAGLVGQLSAGILRCNPASVTLG